MEFVDQMQRSVVLEKTPERIVSLVPSQTQLLHALGLGDRVVGITKFCIYPDEWFRAKNRIGGTKAVSMEKVEALSPDLIIGNKEENERADIENLEKKFPVWMSDIYNLEDALEMIRNLGEITGTQVRAGELIRRIQHNFSEFDAWVSENIRSQSSVAYFIWKDPAYCAGPETFIDAMLQRCGFKNYIEEARYPEFTKLKEDPDFIFLSSEPFPFKEKHVAGFQRQFPQSKVVIVNGEMFSWYGSMLIEAPGYFRELLQQLTLD